MAAIAIASTPASPRAKIDSSRIDLTNLDATTVSQLVFKNAAGNEVGRSYAFAGSSDGKHTFNSFVWPSTGACEIDLINASSGASLATQAVTVQ